MHSDLLDEAICDDSALTIDKEWMGKLENISTARQGVELLIRNAEELVTEVKPAIYEAVYQDYQERRSGVLSELQPVALHIENELAEIGVEEEKIRTRLMGIDDGLDEQSFRCRVGEFSEEELSEKVGALAEVRKNLMEKLEIVDSTYSQCSKYLGDGYRNDVSDVEALELQQDAKVVSTDPVLAEIADLSERIEEEAAALVLAEESESKPCGVEVQAAESTTATMALQACLQMVNSKGGLETFELGGEGLSIGKSSTNDIVIRRAGVSRKHAQVAWLEDGEYAVIDLSGRGVEVNGKRTDEAVIKSGDTITIGKVEIEFATMA